MRYFNKVQLDKIAIFHKLPQDFHRSGPKEVLAYALGATLYMPATRDRILEDIQSEKLKELKSLVICLEDAVGDKNIKEAEVNLIIQLKRIMTAIEGGVIDINDIPLLFIRIRDTYQINMIMEVIKDNCLLTGFVFPKLTHEKGAVYFKTLENNNEKYNQKMYAMPVLEERSIIYKESRWDNLLKIKALFDKYKDIILNIRIGSTDFSSLFGLRRSIDTSVYDVVVVRECIADIINLFHREEEQYVISGSVWEYYYANQQLEHYDLAKEALSGLIREANLDKENGLIGKTIIHPSQILPVQALTVVTHEEYWDAIKILNLIDDDNGVVKSIYENKMNEVKPHYNWAKKVIKKSEIYGVFKEGKSYVDLLK